MKSPSNLLKGTKKESEIRFKTTIGKDKISEISDNNIEHLPKIPKRRQTSIKKNQTNIIRSNNLNIVNFEESIVLGGRLSESRIKSQEKNDFVENPKYTKIFSQIENFVKKAKKSIEFQDQYIEENLPFRKGKSLKSANSMKKNVLESPKIQIATYDKISIKKNNTFNTKNFGGHNSFESKENLSELNEKVSSLVNDGIEQEVKKKQTSENDSIIKESFREDNYRSLKKCNNVFESLSDDFDIEGFNNEKKRIILIQIDSWFRIIFDFFKIIFVLYTVLILPLIIAFQEASFDNSFTIIIQNGIDFFFILEIIFNFFSQIYDEEENIISNRRIICQRYLAGTFILDFVSAIPISIIQYFDNGDIIFLLNFIITLKWLKMVRIFKLFSYKKITEITIFENIKINRVFKVFLIFLIFVHISSCLWIFTGYESVYFGNANWLIYGNFSNLNPSQIYLSAFYFNLVSIYTIGYGDIFPLNLNERIYTIFLLLIGTMFFSFGISSLSTLFGNVDSKKAIFVKRIKVLEEIAKEHRLKETIFKNIKQNILYEYHKNNADKYELLDSLPTHVKNELTVLMYRSLIKELQFFKNQSHDYILFVLPFLKSHRNLKGQVLYSVGEYIEEMYLVVKGCLALNLGSLYEHLEICLIKENNHFGELFMQINKQSTYEMKCKSSYSELLVLKKKDFTLIKKSFPDNAMKMLRESLKTLETIEKRRQQYEKLYRFANSVKEVRKMVMELNSFLLQRDFNEYYYFHKDLQEANDFIVNNSFKNITNILFEYYEKQEREAQEMKEKRQKDKEETDQISDKYRNTKSIVFGLKSIPTWRKYSLNEKKINTYRTLKQENKINNNISLKNQKSYVNVPELHKFASEREKYRKHNSVFFSNRGESKINSNIESSSSSLSDLYHSESKNSKNGQLKTKKCINKRGAMKKTRSNKNLEMKNSREVAIHDFKMKIMKTENFDDIMKEENELNEKTLTLLNYEKSKTFFEKSKKITKNTENCPIKRKSKVNNSNDKYNQNLDHMRNNFISISNNKSSNTESIYESKNEITHTNGSNIYTKFNYLNFMVNKLEDNSFVMEKSNDFCLLNSKINKCNCTKKIPINLKICQNIVITIEKPRLKIQSNKEKFFFSKRIKKDNLSLNLELQQKKILNFDFKKLFKADHCENNEVYREGNFEYEKINKIFKLLKENYQ